MANNWEDVANCLLRNRSIRKMVDEVLKSLDETDQDCHMSTVEIKKHENKNQINKERKIGRLGIRQRQQLLKQYKLKKNITQETEKELARELNLSEVIVNKWFNNRRKREALRLKRNRMILNTTQQNSIHLHDRFVHKCPLKMNYYTSMKDRNISLHSNAQGKVGISCDVSVNDDIEITAVKKFDSKQNYRKNSTGFVFTRDENGIYVLHEQ